MHNYWDAWHCLILVGLYIYVHTVHMQLCKKNQLALKIKLPKKFSPFLWKRHQLTARQFQENDENNKKWQDDRIWKS